MELYRKYRGIFFESSTFQKVQEHKNRSTDSFSNNCINVIEKLVGGLPNPPIGSENPDRTSFGDSRTVGIPLSMPDWSCFQSGICRIGNLSEDTSVNFL